MTFFYDLNKKLDTIREKPATTHKQLNERDMSRAAKGYEKYGKQGMEALAKAGREGKALDPVRKKYDKYDEPVEESIKDKAKLVGHLAKDMARKGLEKLGGGSDADQIRDLQKKMGVPQTGKKPGATEDYGPMEAGAPMTPKQKSFAKLAPPADKITFADKIAGAKKEVDERIGDVAAEAIKNALSPKQKKIDMNKNGKLDATDFEMLRKGVKKQPADESSADNAFTAHKRPRVDAPKVGSVTRGHKHDIEQTATGRKVTRRVDDQGNSVGADDASDAEPQKRGRGRPSGTGSKMGAKGPSGKSKLMTKENDRDPGEYDQEGDMAKDSIKTVVRHAQALEKILGDNDNLPEWVQSKLAKIEGMMTAVDDYMQNQEGNDEMAMGEESTRKRDSHAEKAGKKVTKDIEYDEKKKDGIHGKKRGSEDAKAEKAGKKVAKDIEYDDKKDKKEDKPKKVKEQGGAETPTASSGFSYGKGIYDSMNRELEKMIAESMSVNMSDSTEGGKSLTITATDEDALKLAGLLKNAGLGGGEGMGQEMGHGDEHGEESCPSCGMNDCGCGDIDEALAENNPDWPTDTVTGGENDPHLRMNSGGVDGPKSTGQSQVPVLASQEDRQHTYEEDEALRRMMEMAGVQQDNLKPWERTMKEDAEEDVEDAEDDAEDAEEKLDESFEEMLSRMRDIAGIKEAKKPDFLDIDKDGDKKEPMAKAAKDKEKKVDESIFALTNQWKAYKG